MDINTEVASAKLHGDALKDAFFDAIDVTRISHPGETYEQFVDELLLYVDYCRAMEVPCERPDDGTLLQWYLDYSVPRAIQRLESDHCVSSSERTVFGFAVVMECYGFAYEAVLLDSGKVEVICASRHTGKRETWAANSFMHAIVIANERCAYIAPSVSDTDAQLGTFSPYRVRSFSCNQ